MVTGGSFKEISVSVVPGSHTVGLFSDFCLFCFGLLFNADQSYLTNSTFLKKLFYVYECSRAYMTVHHVHATSWVPWNWSHRAF